MNAILLCALVVFSDVDPAVSRESLEVREPKSKGAALRWSLAATLVPVLTAYLISTKENVSTEPWLICGIPGLLIGPSTGHFYAGQWGRGLKTAGMRFGVIASTIVLLGSAVLSEEYESAEGIALAGLLAFSGLVLYDIATVPQSVEKHNEFLEMKGKVLLAPEIDMQNKRYGIGVRYFF